MSNPRKFSEKIALHAQKQAEGTAAFEAIMKEVSSTTKAALARKIANKQQQQLLSQQNHAIGNDSQHPQDPPSLPSSFVYNSGQNLIRQEPIAYKGQSLPNVNQMVNKPIDLKMALTSLENIKHEVLGRRASSSSSRCVDKLVSRVNKERSSSQPRKHPSISRHRERSPYGSIYLSPPVDPSWRRVSSDSAIHHNVAAGHSKSASRVLINQQHVTSSDNVMVCLTEKQLGLLQQQQVASSDDVNNGRPRSCDVPGINIYPSELAYDNNIAYAIAFQQQQQQQGKVFFNNNSGYFSANNNGSSSLPNLPNNLNKEFASSKTSSFNNANNNTNHSNLSKLCSILIQQDTLTEDNVDNLAEYEVLMDADSDISSSSAQLFANNSPFFKPQQSTQHQTDQSCYSNESSASNIPFSKPDNQNDLYQMLIADDSKNDSQQMLLQYQKMLQSQQQQMSQQINQQNTPLQSVLVTPQLTLQQPITGNFFAQQQSPKHSKTSAAKIGDGFLAQAASMQQKAVFSAVARSEQLLQQQLIQQHLASKRASQDVPSDNQQQQNSLQKKFQEISMSAKQGSELQALLQGDKKIIFLPNNDNNNNNFNNDTNLNSLKSNIVDNMNKNFKYNNDNNLKIIYNTANLNNIFNNIDNNNNESIKNNGKTTTKQDSFSDIDPDIFLTAEEIAHYASKLLEEDLKNTDVIDASLLLGGRTDDAMDNENSDTVVRGKLQREDNSLEECKDTLNILSYINNEDDALQLDPLEVEELQMLADSTIFADPATEDSFRLDRP